MAEEQLFNINSIAIELIKGSTVGALQWIINRGFKHLSIRFIKHAPTLNRWRIFLLLFVWVLANVIYQNYWKPNTSVFLIFTSILVSFIIWKEMTQFWDKGILRLDSSIEKGLNVEGALKLCTNQLDFLGIGASKLTTQPGFEEAVRRCNHPTMPIRFLLTKPDNPLLTDAAKRKGVNPEEYQKRVENSLRTLENLKNAKKLNIEVRFYPCEKDRDVPLFRLMFINNSLCLFSYHVFGEGDGTHAPQLHLERFEDRREVDSFYFPFRVYFDQLWADSMPWDFKFPIN